MKSSDRAILLGVLILGLLAGFYFLLLAPKRDRAAELETKITEVRAAVAEQEQLASAGELARRDYDSNYRRLLVLGKAVPEDDDTSSLFEALDTISAGARVEFRDITLVEGAVAAPAPVAQETTTDQNLAGTDPAAATEAAAAALPIGASVGPAGLPVMPYEVVFRGDFFDVAEVLAGVDRLVGTKRDTVRVGGRLLTVDGFNLERDGREGFPSLKATVALKSYVAPGAQGVTAGATPGVPPAEVPPATPTPTSAPAPAP